MLQFPIAPTRFFLTGPRPYKIIPCKKYFLLAGMLGPCATPRGSDANPNMDSAEFRRATITDTAQRSCAARDRTGPGGIAGGIARAADAYLPIVMPITGFLSVEGGSQRNGAVMALETAKGITIDHPVFDTGTSATGAAAALDKALSQGS